VGPEAYAAWVAVQPRPLGAAAKRGFDLLLSSFGLLLSLPLWVVILLAIKLEDGGPILFIQKRWSRFGRVIRVFKFRTMIKDAERIYGSLQATADDPRITRVGKILRATALDELPQLLNIWLGEMSFVGPRALPKNEIQRRERDGGIEDSAISGFDIRLAVRPGLTGLAQVYAPRDVPRRHKFRYDRLYIRRQSLCLDLRLVLLSVWITLRGGWEQRGHRPRGVAPDGQR
jgi:lipopolysaccharide/colanic/teichoic acid biosynthesis glycosyltransferase